MGKVFLVPGKKKIESLDFILKEFDVDEIIFLAIKDEKIDPKIKELKVKNKIISIEEDVWEEVFKIVQEKRREIGTEKLMIGPIEDYDDLNQSMINSGFINGLKVLSNNKGKITILPLYKFTPYKELTDKKLEIVQLLYSNSDYELNLESIGTNTKMSPPLVSYHINGNIKSEGLKELGLVVSRENHGKSYVKLTKLGILMVKGYLDE